MNIYQATKMAMQTGRGIVRMSWEGKCIVVLSTTGKGCLGVLRNEQGRPYAVGSWRPTADDLVANDWGTVSKLRHLGAEHVAHAPNVRETREETTSLCY